MQPERRALALLKYGSLAFVVVQNTTLILVGVYSRRQGGPQFLGSVAVLLTEVLKTLISLTCALIDSGSGVLSELRGHVVHDPLWVLTFALPSLCYCVHNNLWYVAVTHLEPVTIAVMTQLKIVAAALFSLLLLGRRLGARRWVAIGILMLGLAVVQWHSLRPRGGVGVAAAEGTAAVGRRRGGRAARGAAGPIEAGPIERDEARGLLAMVGLCMLSGFAGALMERLLKDRSRSSSLWIRNLQLALFSLPLAAALVPLADAEALRTHGPLVGLNRWAAAVVVLGASGGVMVSVVFAYADVMLKSFAVGLSVALSALASAALFHTACSPQAAVGIGLVVVASAAYHAEESRQREAGQEGGDAEEESYARLVEAEARDASPGEAREKPGEPRPGEPPRKVPLKAAAAATAVESVQEEGRQGAREEEGEQRQRLVSLSVGGAVRSAWSWRNGMWNGRRQEG